MKSSSSLLLFGAFLAVLVGFTCAADQSVWGSLINENYVRNIDLHTQLVQVESKIRVKNRGKSPVDTYYYAVSANISANLAIVIVRDADSKSETELKVSKVSKISQPNAVFYAVTLPQALSAGSTINLVVYETYFNRMSPLPKKIQIADDQNVEIYENVQCFSGYETEKCTTTLKLPSTPIHYDNIIANARGSVIEYGPFTNLQGFSARFARLHFENNMPFVVFKNVTRSIEVSHWGNILVEDFHRISNEGANLTGEYSRVDYNDYTPRSGKSALKEMHAVLPVHAWGLYFTDEIGNISTSNAYRDVAGKAVRLRVEPRFHIFGGWKSNWVIGYNLPTNHYLKQDVNDPNQFILDLNFGFHFDRILAEDYTIKIILPEGATDIHFDLPFEVDSVTSEKFFSYLDFEGRPVLVLNKRAVLPYHNKVFRVAYKFAPGSILKEPFMIFVACAVFFALTIFLGRLDFSFGHAKQE